MKKVLEDCYVQSDEGTLCIGNDAIERTYDLTRPVPRSASLLDKASGREWIPPDADRPLFRLPGMGEEEQSGSIDFASGTDDRGGLSGQFLWVSLTLGFSHCVVETTFRIHPGVPAISVAHTVRGEPREEDGEEVPPRRFRACRREAGRMQREGYLCRDTVESLPLPGGHLRARTVDFYGVTDFYNDLVREATALLYGPGYEKLRGNLLFLEDTVRPAGLFVVKEAPTPVEQLNYRGWDFQTAGTGVLEVRGSGISAGELDPETPLPSYGCTVGVFDPAEESGEAALRRWYEAEDRQAPDGRLYLLSNTWGNRSQDARIDEEFIRAEIDRGAEIGVDVCQIDCGWQKGPILGPGGSVNSAGRFRDRTSGFWELHPDRFPEGLDSMAEYAQARGVQLGLWFGADTWNEFADWEKDRDRLIELRREHGVSHIKIDFTNIESKRAELRLLRMLEDVLGGGDGAPAVQFDLTNSHRIGYFYRPWLGEIFLENRYTDWGNYYPHHTLRNLWCLSRYVPTRRLEMEFLDVDRNRDVYGDDPLAPHRYSAEYAFAVTMMACPLAWMELSELDEGEVGALHDVVQAWRGERERLLQCDVRPIGEEPSGASWTGFQAVHSDGGGYLLLFRESNDRSEARVRLHGLAGCRLELEQVAGGDCASDGRVDADGGLQVGLAEPRSYALLAYST